MSEYRGLLCSNQFLMLFTRARFEHQSISTPTSLLIVRFTVLAVYTHSEIISGLYAITTFRVNANSVSSLGSQISYCACISPPNHFFLSLTHFSGWFLYYRSVLVFLSLPIFFIFYSLFWMISLLQVCANISLPSQLLWLLFIFLDDFFVTGLF